MNLSGWCSAPPGAQMDQHHQWCRSELCECPAHGRIACTARESGASVGEYKRAGRRANTLPTLDDQPSKESDRRG